MAVDRLSPDPDAPAPPPARGETARNQSPWKAAPADRPPLTTTSADHRYRKSSAAETSTPPFPRSTERIESRHGVMRERFFRGVQEPQTGHAREKKIVRAATASE